MRKLRAKEIQRLERIISKLNPKDITQIIKYLSQKAHFPPLSGREVFVAKDEVSTPVWEAITGAPGARIEQRPDQAKEAVCVNENILAIIFEALIQYILGMTPLSLHRSVGGYLNFGNSLVSGEFTL